VPKMNTWSVKMVNPAHIAQKKYWGCSTPKSVQNFCTRHNVNRFWWTPPEGGRKVLMVDFHDFRENYKDYYGTTKVRKSNATKSNKSKTKVSTRTSSRFKQTKNRKATTRKNANSRSW